MKKRTKHQMAKELVAYHEAGHAVAAWYFGNPIIEARSVTVDDAPGAVIIRPLDSARTDLCDAAELCQVWLAGPVATSIREKWSLLASLVRGGADDYSKVYSLAGNFFDNRRILENWVNELERDTREVLVDYWHVVEAVATALMPGIILSGVEILSLIDRARELSLPAADSTRPRATDGSVVGRAKGE